jgi:hypothetical protein
MSGFLRLRILSGEHLWALKLWQKQACAPSRMMLGYEVGPAHECSESSRGMILYRQEFPLLLRITHPTYRRLIQLKSYTRVKATYFQPLLASAVSQEKLNS